MFHLPDSDVFTILVFLFAFVIFYYFAISLSLRKYRFSLFRLLSFPTCSRIPTLLPSTFSIFHYRYVSFFRFLFFPSLFYASLPSIFFLPFNIQLTFPHYPILPLCLRFLSLSYFFLFPLPLYSPLFLIL